MNLLSRGINILVYHRIYEEKDLLCPEGMTKDLFEHHLFILNKFYNVVTLSTALDLSLLKKIPKNTVVITFDDGYKETLKVALPLLKKYKMPATLFVTTGCLNDGIMWNDAVAELLRYYVGYINLSSFRMSNLTLLPNTNRVAIINQLIKALKYQSVSFREEIIGHISDTTKISPPKTLMLTDNDIITLSKNRFEIGAHTVNHPILSTLSHEDSLNEIESSKIYLEKILKKNVTHFAYPNGRLQDYNHMHVQALKALGFRSAVTTQYGFLNNTTDSFQIPRYTPWMQQIFAFKCQMKYPKLCTI